MARLEAGAIFAGHRIEGPVGRGGMGVVYRATDLALERVVALKVIAPVLAEDPAFRERFQMESRVAASIRHPHVITIHHAAEEDGQLFVTMDLIEGGDLGALIDREGRLDPALAARLLAQVASALDAAHARGLVHRDVKPGNVLIAGEGEPAHAYLTDFGLTKRLSAGCGITATGVLVGTVDYIAPEQVEGRRLDPRTDVYALGCVVFHALTGRVPYPRDNDMATLYAHTMDPPPSLRDIVPEHDVHELDAVVRRAMAKDPEQRFQTAGALGHALSAATSQPPPTLAATRTAAATMPAAPRPSTAPPATVVPAPSPALAPSAALSTPPAAPPPPSPPSPAASPTAVTPLAVPPVRPAAVATAGPRPAGRWAAVVLAAAALIVAVVVLVLVVRPAGEDTSPGGEMQGTPTGSALPAPQPAPLQPTTDADRAAARAAAARSAIRNVLRRYESAYSSQDLSGLSAIFTADVKRHGLRARGCSDTTGRSNVLDAYAEQFATGTGRYQLTDLSSRTMSVARNSAQVNTGYSISTGGAGSIAFRFRRAGGEWRITAINASC